MVDFTICVDVAKALEINRLSYFAFLLKLAILMTDVREVLLTQMWLILSESRSTKQRTAYLLVTLLVLNEIETVETAAMITCFIPAIYALALRSSRAEVSLL